LLASRASFRFFFDPLEHIASPRTHTISPEFFFLCPDPPCCLPNSVSVSLVSLNVFPLVPGCLGGPLFYVSTQRTKVAKHPPCIGCGFFFFLFFYFFLFFFSFFFFFLLLFCCVLFKAGHTSQPAELVERSPCTGPYIVPGWRFGICPLLQTSAWCFFFGLFSSHIFVPVVLPAPKRHILTSQVIVPSTAEIARPLC